MINIKNLSPILYEHKTTPWLLRARLRRLGFGVALFTDLKTEKNGGFRADTLAKYHRFLFFEILFKDFRKILYAKIRHVPLLYWRCRILTSSFLPI